MSDENIFKSIHVTLKPKYYDEEDHQTIFNYFKKLGVIENFIILDKDTRMYDDDYGVLITFHMCYEATEISMNKKRQYSIEYLDEWLWEESLYVPYNLPYIKCNESLPSPLLPLPNDCLLQISKYLDELDLIELSKTCKTMKTFVDEIIFAKYKTLQLNCKSSKLSIYILRYFNKKMLSKRCSQLDEFHTLHHIFIFNLIATYFYNLQTLHLIYARKINVEYLKLHKKELECSHKLNQLKVLSLYRCENVCDNIISATSNLIELNLTQSYAFFYTAIVKKLCHLKKLLLNDCKLDWKNVLNFLQQNNQLTHLTLKTLDEKIFTPELYSTILNMKSLQYLALDYDAEWPLENLNCLKSLTFKLPFMSHGQIPSLEALADKDQLEKLEIIGYSESKDTQTVFEHNLLRFTKIQTLNVNKSKNLISEKLLLQLATKWNLISLNCSGMSLSDDAILKIVEINKNMNYLHCIELSPSLICRIIDMIKNDPERPKLTLIARIDEESESSVVNDSGGRVNIRYPLCIYEQD